MRNTKVIAASVPWALAKRIDIEKGDLTRSRYLIKVLERHFQQNAEVIAAANLLGSAMIQFVQDLDNPEWIGSASQLYIELEARAASLNISTRDRAWPKSASSLSRRLNLIKTNLREIGIELDKCYLDDNRRSRGVKIRKMPTAPTAPSVASDIDQNHAQTQTQN